MSSLLSGSWKVNGEYVPSVPTRSTPADSSDAAAVEPPDGVSVPHAPSARVAAARTAARAVRVLVIGGVSWLNGWLNDELEDGPDGGVSVVNTPVREVFPARDVRHITRRR